jgi:hypothetical protein
MLKGEVAPVYNFNFVVACRGRGDKAPRILDLTTTAISSTSGESNIDVAHG